MFYSIDTLAEHLSHENVLLPCVDACYLLKMWNSKREPEYEILKRLSPRCILQTNMAGRKGVPPKHGVQHTHQDISHANISVCKDAQKRGFETIAIVEDDVEFAFDAPELRVHLQRVNDFITTNRFMMYSLGSFGAKMPFALYHRQFIGESAFAQCVILSKAAIALYAQLNVSLLTLPHDALIMSELPNRYTYYIPLTRQIFPRTENSDFWRRGQRKWWIQSLQLDQYSEPGWTIMNTFSDVSSMVVALVVTVLGLCTVLGANRSSKGQYITPTAITSASMAATIAATSFTLPWGGALATPIDSKSISCTTLLDYCKR